MTMAKIQPRRRPPTAPTPTQTMLPVPAAPEREAGWARAADLTISAPGTRGYERPRATAAEDATLTESVRVRGVLQSVLVERLPDGVLSVRNGRRRVAAALAVGPDTRVPYLVLTEAEATLSDVELELVAHELNALSSPPCPWDLALSARAALDAGVDRERVIIAVGGVPSRLTRLLALAARAGAHLTDAVRFGTIGEAGAMILIEASGEGEGAHALQRAALDILDAEAAWAAEHGTERDGGVRVSNRLTGATKASDVTVENYREGRWSASRAACEVAAERAAATLGRQTRRRNNRSPVVQPVATPAPAPAPVEVAAPVEAPSAPQDAPEAPAPTPEAPTAPEAPQEAAQAPQEAPPLRLVTPPAEAPQAPAPTPTPRPRGARPPAAPAAPTLADRVSAAHSRAMGTSLARATERQRGALLAAQAVLAYLSSGRRPEGAVHEAIGVVFDAIFPTD